MQQIMMERKSDERVVEGSVTNKADHVAWAAEVIAVFQRHCKRQTSMPSQI
jgi:hypothetical protein